MVRLVGWLVCSFCWFIWLVGELVRLVSSFGWLVGWLVGSFGWLVCLVHLVGWFICLFGYLVSWLVRLAGSFG